MLEKFADMELQYRGESIWIPEKKFGDYIGAGDDETFLALDQAFNTEVGAACRNPFAQTTMEQWNPLSRRFWYQHHRRVGDLPQMAALHAAIARAIGHGDGPGAAAASDRLMDYLEGFTRAALDADR